MVFLKSGFKSVLIASTACVVAAASSTSTIRGSQEPVRIPPFQRIYGEENAHVRRAIHEIETESTHYRRTGVLGDPNHKVDYDHPIYDKERRKLLTDEQIKNYFKPIRITFHLDAMNNLRNDANGKQIDFVTNEILPKMKDFWSSALKVVPVGSLNGNPLKLSTAELTDDGFCGHNQFTKVPNEHITNGIADTDIILYISASSSATFCGPSTLAVAVSCNSDQYDRPTAGAINFCLDQIKLDDVGTAHPSIIQDNVDVAIHEAAHVFGMSSNSYKYFWDSVDIKPRTPRPFTRTTVECVDGATRTLRMPSEETLKFVNAENGQRHALIVTPKVRAVARNHFNCQSLEGAQLENQPTGANSCSGDHWDERLFYPESLSGIVSPTSVILSPLTLALFEDSGWYSANFTMAELIPWGHGAGCDFVNKPCLVKDDNGETVVPEYGKGYFCADSGDRGCSSSHHYKAGCNLVDYSVFINQEDPPERFQYFSKPSLGGTKQVDYCPVFGSIYRSNAHQLDCRLEDNGSLVSFYGESYGENSRCFESSSGTGRCYKSACNLQLRKLQVAVKVKEGNTVADGWVTCDYDFQEIKIEKDVIDATLSSTIICPRLSDVCPDMFCPANCAGRGVCNWQNLNENGDPAPKCECFDSSDTSAGCAETAPLDGKYIADESGLENLNTDKFFDPLIAVFTENPDTWETASWIWASAILVLFLLLLLCICSTFWPKKDKRKKLQRSDDYYERRNHRGGYY